MSHPLVNETFRCDRFGLLTVKACLRRQLDRQQPATPGGPRLPRAPFCAESCRLGLEKRMGAHDAGIAYASCSACGDALIDTDPEDCATCAGRRVEAGVPRGTLPGPKERAMKSTRIWTGEVPDVPIGPPPRARPALPPLLPRSHHPAPIADHLEEDPMPKPDTEKRTCSTPGCSTKLRSDNRTGVCAGCQRSSTKFRPKKAAPKPRQVRISGPPPGVTPARRSTARASPAPVSPQPNLALYPDDALIDLRGLVEAEIRDRLVARKAAVQSLQSALGEAA